jgi:hypothetical protein
LSAVRLMQVAALIGVSGRSWYIIYLIYAGEGIGLVRLVECS